MARAQVLVGRGDHPHVHVHRRAARPRAGSRRSWSTRKSFAWNAGGSRRSRRGRACRRPPPRSRPRRARTAPVKAPFAWPKSSLSSRVSLMAAQFTGTNGRSARSSCRVDGARDELLAGAALAGDRAPSRRSGPRARAGAAARASRSSGRPARQAVPLPRTPRPAAPDSAPAAGALQRPLHADQQLALLERLGDVVVARRGASPRPRSRWCRSAVITMTCVLGESSSAPRSTARPSTGSI